MGVVTDRSGTTARARRALWMTLVLNAALLAAEATAGWLFGSLVLLADAAHQVSDVAALGVALVAQSLATRPGTARHTYGLRRAEALGAQANATLLLGAAALIFIEGARRLGSPGSVNGTGVVVVASVALCVNVGSAALLTRVRGVDLNLRGAFLHMAGDAAASIAAIAAGIAVLVADANWVDPLASLAVGALIVVSAWSLVRDTTNVLLEGAPRGLDPARLEEAISTQPQVEAVHHLHVWELASDLPALSVHVVLRGEPSLHDAQVHGDALRAMLVERFGIEHATLELECHDCEAATHERHARDAIDRGAGQ